MAVTNDGIKTFAAGEALEAHRRVKLNGTTTTQVVYADADDEGIGTTLEKVDNGDHVAVRMHGDPGTHKVTCSAAVDAGDILYGTDDGKVEDTTTADGPGLYVALEAGSADGAIIEAIPLPAGSGSRVLYANLADSAEVENTTTETAFDKSKTIDGASLKVGDVLEIIASANVVDNNSTDTLTLKLYVGTEEIISTGAVDVADGDVGFIHAFVVVRVVGSSGKISATGVHGLGVPGTVTAKPFMKAEATEDISGDVAITVKATWSVAHADNEVELENLIIIKHRQ